VRYFEDAREDFGKVHGISYLDFYRNGLAVPIVKMECDFKKPLRYGDTMIVETSYMNMRAAKLKFDYRIFDNQDGTEVASGSSLQVFVDAKTFELQLTVPDFFEAWRKKMNFT
jgi:acyl-CoA thioester hydrolase